MNNFFCCLPCTRKSRLWRLYQKSTEKIEGQLDIAKILENIKDAKIFMKQKFLNKTEQFNIEHNNRNLVRLDSSFSEETSEDSSTSKDSGEEKEKKSF
jgi:hypothetical protein